MYRKFTMASIGDGLVCQHGALPFVIGGHGEIKVLLVTTRGRGDWIIPKGWPIRGLTAPATAKREAFEEAGVIGSIIGDKPVGSYRYEKRWTARKVITCEVSVFLMAVERQLRKWPEKSERDTRWFAPEDAANVVAPAGLAGVLRDAVGLMLVNVG
jgi:8-oxo-dGTP pyrophosphatase MutT (NUDIX family)